MALDQRRKKFLAIFICLLLVALTTDSVSACPTCKESLAAGGPGADNMVQGYFWSILFMMSMPFLILTGMGTYMYLLVKRAQAASGGGLGHNSGSAGFPLESAPSPSL